MAKWKLTILRGPNIYDVIWRHSDCYPDIIPILPRYWVLRSFAPNNVKKVKISFKSQFSFGHRIFKNASFDLLFFLKPVLLSWILRISQRQSTTDSSLFSRSRQKCAFFSAENIDSMKNKNFLAQAGGWNGFYTKFWSRKSLVERNSIADSDMLKGQRFWLKKSKKGSGRLKNTLKSVFHIIKSLKRAPGGWKTL